MDKLAICKSIWKTIPQKAKITIALLPIVLTPFVIPPSLTAPLLITGHEDKLFHVFFFAGLAFILGIKRSVVPLAALFLLGLSIEGIQALMPHRSACGYDIMANGIGIVVGGLLKLRGV